MTNKIYNFYTLSALSSKDNVRYVGVTVKTVEQRFYQHRYCAKNPKKRGLPVHKWMWSHYEKGDDIIVTQIDSCEESEWQQREQYWIKFYKDNGFDLMNIDKGGNGVITLEKRTKDSIQRSIDGHEKPVIALYKDGSFFKEYSSIKEATKELGLKSKSSISNVLRGKSKSSAGYLWVYKDNYNVNNQYTYNPIYKGTTIYEFDIDGLLLNKYPSKKYFDSIKGFSLNGITSAIENKSVYHDHYWSTAKNINISEYEPYFLYKEIDQENNIIEMYRTQTEICEKFNLNSASVCIRIKKHKLFGKNYICKI